MTSNRGYAIFSPSLFHQDVWFYCEELGTWLWTEPTVYYPWFFRPTSPASSTGGDWLHLLAFGPSVLFYNHTQNNDETYPYGDPFPPNW